ncbi:formate dehydrogenase accessory sulfurtransferase FdhD [Adlercreutzia equolifaciens]|uniref:formate dehydrogenase accessory sulfurtransferase FdhD n=1 Tax=Adlercreutzia equolifaciens TaxID=446660 RepID=UPI00136F6B20|nr:formate dehydrogenase accessory sulfurtransferase FdhD [Adlercreutzia equolifaciens]MDR3995973.1 formate dehydrogenase accessory sulfurtransferase FdhD [Adlercreutzia sp.]MEE0476863.1 formate dehydrogenase accessory sulfurtransferase FdhD [Adlercreutzia sp.]MEE0581879.1 formate dehydrogenase accessory sulfurtransferase FdhD [Adlercreutzia sp.]
MENTVQARAVRVAGECEAFPRSYFSVVCCDEGDIAAEAIEVICEHELTIVANGCELATLMCSNANLSELVYGFLFSEGVIGDVREVVAFDMDAARRIARLSLSHPVRRPAAPVITSGFGGKALAAPSGRFLPSLAVGTGACSLPETLPVPTPGDIDLIRGAVMAMRVGAREYAATRGTHCSALFCRDEMVALYEDIGRHNTFDKLAGHCLTRGIDATGFLLATTGRVSSEMLRKAARLGVGTVASLSGPTDAAVREARGRGMTLAGYVNSSRLTLYAASTVTAVPEAVTMSMLP